MDTTKAVKTTIAIVTALTNIALVSGLVWSIATGKSVILPITLGLLELFAGYFSYRDFLYFFGKK